MKPVCQFYNCSSYTSLRENTRKSIFKGVSCHQIDACRNEKRQHSWITCSHWCHCNNNNTFPTTESQWRILMIAVYHIEAETKWAPFRSRHFNCIFLNENVWIPIKISLKFVPKDPMNNITALVQIIAWRRPGNKPLSEPMMVNLLTHICVTRPQRDMAVR